MKKALLALAALTLVLAVAGSVLGCNNGTTTKKNSSSSSPGPSGPSNSPGPGGPVLKDYIIREMADFDIEGGSPNAQKGWALDGTEETPGNTIDNDFTAEQLEAAKYLIVEIKDSSNPAGIGGFQIYIQSNGNGWNWNNGETNLVTNVWFGYPMTSGTTYYIVIDLTALNTYDDFIDDLSGGAKITLAYYNALFAADAPTSNIGYQTAYLAKAALTKPAGSTDLNSGKGFVSEDIVIWE
jgi:hypothetical protein